MRYCLPVSTLHWCSVAKMCKMAKAAGFDMVEFLLAGWILEHPEEAAEMARDEGLDVRFHLAWTRQTSSEQTLFWCAAWRILTSVGWLPKQGSTFWEMAPPIITDAVVVYAENLLNGLQVNHYVQTMSTMKDGRFQISRADADRRLLGGVQLVVFDTYHDLHFRDGGLQILEENSRVRLLELMVADYKMYGSRIAEIHIQDWSKTGGRSVWPGTGDLPIREFLLEVVNRDSELILTPETKPIMRNVADGLKRLCNDVQDLVD